MHYVGLDVNTLINWIEFQFDEKMCWENQGTYWDIDHVIPCIEFNLTIEDNIKKCFHWTNLRPLEKTENNKKNSKHLDDVIAKHQIIVEQFKSLYTDTKLSKKLDNGSE